MASIRIREIDSYANALEKGIKKIEKMSRDVPKELEDNLNYIGYSIVTEWYDSYDRLSYDPMMSFLHAYKIEINDRTWGYKFGPEYMDGYNHHQSNELIYHNSFELGYHGGSRGDGCPGSAPYWRTPSPFYPNWYKPAKKTFSPKKKMETAFNKEIEKTIDKTKKELNEIIYDIKKTAFQRKASSK